MIIEEIYIPKIKVNIKFYIGKNATENFEIIDIGSDNDLWFHLNDCSSCHVIGIINHLELNKKELRSIIIQGAIICKKYSKYKSKENVNIIFTTLNNVVKTNIIGTVNLIKSKIINI